VQLTLLLFIIIKVADTWYDIDLFLWYWFDL